MIETNAHVDILKKMREQVEQEMITLRNALAGKQKTLDSLNTTIDLMRGWVDPEEVAPRIVHTGYDDKAIAEGIRDFFLENPGSHKINAIVGYLESKDLVPSGRYTASRSKVGIVLKTMNAEIELLGIGPAAKYQTISPNGASHVTTNSQSATR